MTIRWEDLTARVRGLSGHLLTREALEDLATKSDLPALANGLAAYAPGLGEHGADPAELELAARREATRRLQILGRWLGPRQRVMAVFLDDEDRRSLRAIIRGAVAGTGREARLSGLIPTPALPERVLEELAGQASPAAIAGLLVAWKHPFGSALFTATRDGQPDLTRIELVLHRAYAEQARRGAKRGGSLLVEYVTETIDLLNAEAALMLASGDQEIPLEEAYLEGGRVLTRDIFRRTAAAASPREAWQVLQPVFRKSTLAAGFAAAELPGSFEAGVLAARVAFWHRKARVAPVGAAPVIEYLLRLRAQVLQLRTLVWGAALGMPPSTRKQLLLTV